MRSKFLIAAAILFVAVTSCKKEEAKPAEATAPKVEEKKFFNVEITATAERDDDFAVYYTEDGTINFTGEQAVWGGIKDAQTEPKTVVFNLPEDVVPTDLRIDFGLKKGAEQGDVVLYGIKFKNYNKSFEIKGQDFPKYFFNEAVKTEVDAVKGTVKILKNPASDITPFFYPTQLLLDEVAKITK